LTEHQLYSEDKGQYRSSTQPTLCLNVIVRLTSHLHPLSYGHEIEIVSVSDGGVALSMLSCTKYDNCSLSKPVADRAIQREEKGSLLSSTVILQLGNSWSDHARHDENAPQMLPISDKD
jgi:hypothetical protein